MAEDEAGAEWTNAAIWAVPIALWLSTVAVVGVALPWQWHEWRTNVSLWPPAIAQSRARGDVEMVAKQEAWLKRDDRSGLLIVSVLGAVLALTLVAPFAYLRLVPRPWRADGRGFLLAVPVLFVLAALGYLVLANMLRGVIKG